MFKRNEHKIQFSEIYKPILYKLHNTYEGNITSEYTNENGSAAEECCHILKSNQAKLVRRCII